MRAKEIATGLLLGLICIGLLVFSPNILTMAFIFVMALLICFGYFIGIRNVLALSRGFKVADREIMACRQVTVHADDQWLVIRQKDSLFKESKLDHIFNKYRQDVEHEYAMNASFRSDIEDYINEEKMEIKTRRGLVSMIPNALTGLGILGTFIGLVYGVNSISFSSVDMAITSVSTVLDGIHTAFYTSISGIALSLIFSFIYQWYYNDMIDRMYSFIDLFHKRIIASADEQIRDKNEAYQQKVIETLEAIKRGTV